MVRKPDNSFQEVLPGVLRVGGKDVPSLALTLMLAGVVLPSVFYSYRLIDPTPSELLVAICIALFSSIVFLWILDAVSILRFRSEWVSRSIYGAAIASVLGTSVAVYKDAFTTRKYSYEGGWQLQITPQTQAADVSLPILLMFSEQSDVYWGYSEFHPSKDPEGTVWVQVTAFAPKGVKANVSIRLISSSGREKIVSAEDLKSEHKGKLFYGLLNDGSKIRLSRPN
jgi:hypothetical protein